MASESGAPSREYQLVTTVTPDLVKLHGLYQKSTCERRTQIDAAVLLHGLGGNFYSSTLNLRLADCLVELGVSVILGNTRGHDGISMSPVGGRAQTIGAAYEIVDDCKNDVAGWTDWLSGKSHQRLLLVGHSLGAIKALYAQAHLPQASVAGIVGLSATRLCHQSLLDSPRGEDFRHWFELADHLTRSGKGDELMNVSFPFPAHMSAAAYFNKYGPDDQYDWLQFYDRISEPVLLLFGEKELAENPAFHGLWKLIQSQVTSRDNFQAEQVASANHFYAGVHHRATTAMQSWLQNAFSLR